MTEAILIACEERAIEYLAGGENHEETLRLRLAYVLGANDVSLLVAEVRRLQQALRRYGRQEAGPDGCHYDPCTCGLAEALEGKG